ncbi:MAG: hypothetical protein JRJ79_14740 [Deltaproteobacteria bacterium]|nr:hypothetical protein [Deltaproteobacteria bacterium]MBW1795787.1 hypothetical protein [Deltaproteobacteria bacterium]
MSGSVQGYDGLLSGMVSLIEEVRRVSALTVNAIMTATYWEMGRKRFARQCLANPGKDCRTRSSPPNTALCSLTTS